jgi:LTXXQ motif family protein
MVSCKTCASLILLLGLSATPALAQQQAHPEHHPPAATTPEAAMPSQGMPGGMPIMAMMAGHVEGRLAFLNGGMMGAGTLPDKLAMREKMMTAHLDALRKLKAVVDPLYAALSDEQKKTADEIMLMGPMGMM